MVADVHPIERLRYIARSSGDDQRSLIADTAMALRTMGSDAAGLVVACRRLVEHHPTSGPMWWLCAHLLAADDCAATARRLASEINEDTTSSALLEALPLEATVCIVGWPELVGEALMRRDDLQVLHIAELADVSPCVLAADVVLVEAMAASPTEMLVAPGSRAAAATAYCSEVPVWAVVGVGRCLPEQGFQVLTERASEAGAGWRTDAELMPLALCSHVVDSSGFRPLSDDRSPLVPECPLALELTKR